MQEPTTLEDIEIAPCIRETASEDGAVLLDIEQGICFSLNPVGLKIWNLLKKGYSTDQIADALSQDFQVPRSLLLTDTLEFIHALEKEQLVHRPSHTATKRSWLSKLLPRTSHKATEAR